MIHTPCYCYTGNSSLNWVKAMGYAKWRGVYALRPWVIAPLVSGMLLLTGCASLEPIDHPKEWGSSLEKPLPNGCPDLSGTYSTRANAAYPVNVDISPPLNEIFGPIWIFDTQVRDRPWPALPGATMVTLAQNADWLNVRFHDDAKGEATVRFKKKHWWGGVLEGADSMYQCLELELGPALGFDGAREHAWLPLFVVSSRDYAFIFLSKARDGSLLVNYRIDRILLSPILIGPYASWIGSAWWRYPPVMPSQ